MQTVDIFTLEDQAKQICFSLGNHVSYLKVRLKEALLTNDKQIVATQIRDKEADKKETIHKSMQCEEKLEIKTLNANLKVTLKTKYSK